MFILNDVTVCRIEMRQVVELIKFLLNVVRFAIPIVLIVLGTFDLFKAVTAGKDEDIKKKQQVLIKRVIAGVIVFLVPTIVFLLMGWLGNEDWKECWNPKNPDTAKFQDLFKG